MPYYNTENSEALKERMKAHHHDTVTLSFYKYARIGNPQVFRDHIYQEWNALQVVGRIYVAREGINAQLSLPKAQFECFQESLRRISFLENVLLNIAVEADKFSFYKLKIKVKPKIVADGLNDESFDVTRGGRHIDAERFNQLTSRNDTVLIDMRNHYESEVGHFEGAILPDVDTFRDSLPIIEDMLEAHRDKHIVMYCTGGIRCEKASAYFKHKGFEKVYQLEGGIVKYAHEVRKKGLPNKFHGKNFVFDERLGERISDEIIARCHQCGAPCDVHTNCKHVGCNLLFIQCDACAEKYEGCCSEQCQEMMHLPEEEQAAWRRGKDQGIRIFTKGRFPNPAKTSP